LPPTSRGFLPWRLSDDGPSARGQSREGAVIRNPSQERPLAVQQKSREVAPQRDATRSPCTPARRNDRCNSSRGLVVRRVASGGGAQQPAIPVVSAQSADDATMAPCGRAASLRSVSTWSTPGARPRLPIALAGGRLP
jgi:hypothetical protein